MQNIFYSRFVIGLHIWKLACRFFFCFLELLLVFAAKSSSFLIGDWIKINLCPFFEPVSSMLLSFKETYLFFNWIYKIYNKLLFFFFVKNKVFTAPIFFRRKGCRRRWKWWSSSSFSDYCETQIYLLSFLWQCRIHFGIRFNTSYQK